MLIYADLLKITKKYCFSFILTPISILAVLFDRAKYSDQNFYTEFRNSLIMLTYRDLLKITKYASFPSFFVCPILILIVLSYRAKYRARTPTQNLEIH